MGWSQLRECSRMLLCVCGGFTYDFLVLGDIPLCSQILLIWNFYGVLQYKETDIVNMNIYKLY